MTELENTGPGGILDCSIIVHWIRDLNAEGSTLPDSDSKVHLERQPNSERVKKSEFPDQLNITFVDTDARAGVSAIGARSDRAGVSAIGARSLAGDWRSDILFLWAGPEAQAVTLKHPSL